MKRLDDTPTLLVFTLGPECERSRRRLLPGSFQQAEDLVHAQGLQGVLEAGRRAGYKIVVASVEPLDLPAHIEQIPQDGYSFEQRLRGVIRTLQARLQGSPLVVVGTDSPDLDAHHLEQAVSLLTAFPDDVVLGPSYDGGFYLLAACADLDDHLAQVRWCRRDTRRSLTARLRHGGREVRLLMPLQDLDQHTDLEVWLTVKTPSLVVLWLKGLLLAILAAWKRPWAPLHLGGLHQMLVSPVLGRGPPL